MSTCPKCAAPIAPDAKFCTECGASVPAANGSPCSDESHTILAAANLCKLRGDWQAAIDKCMLVLALDEDNAAAHSVLGDIYRDQGHLSEAIHWYKLALDLDPESTADKTKLDQLLAQGHASLQSVTDRKAEVILTAKRVLAEAALAIGLLLLITTIWPIIWQPKHLTSEIRPPAQHPQTVRLPTTIPDDTQQPEPAQPPHTPMSSHEDALIQALNAAPALTQRSLNVKSILVDPRNRSAVVTCVCPQQTEQPAAEALVRSGLIVLRELCFKDSQIEQFTVRALYGDGQADVRFVADALRSGVLAIDPQTAGYSQLVGALRNPWWGK